MTSPETIRIIVNLRPVEVPAGPVSYEQIAELAGRGRNMSLTVTWRYRDGRAVVSGLLRPGDSVHVRDGAVFVATRTGAA